MKMCQRCGEQSKAWWRLDIETRKLADVTQCDYSQSFYVCEECRQEVFDRLSRVLTDAPRWKPAVTD